MDTDLVSVSVIKPVRSPSELRITAVRGKDMSVETARFDEFSANLNRFMEDNSFLKQTMNCSIGHVYAGKRPKDNLWYRVRVENFLERRSGVNALCYFLDKGVRETIPIKNLRVIPTSLKHTEVKYQVRNCCLHGLKPLTMALSPAIEPAMNPCSVWDSSAKVYVNQLISKSSVVKMKVIDLRRDGVELVRLYVETPDGQICLNDDLVEKQYATWGSAESDIDGSDTASVISTDSIQMSQSSDSSYPSSPEKISDINRKKLKIYDKFLKNDLYAETLAELGLAPSPKPSKYIDDDITDMIKVPARQTSRPNNSQEALPKPMEQIQDTNGEIKPPLSSTNFNPPNFSPGTNSLRLPCKPTALDYYRLTLPKSKFALSDTDSSYSSDSSFRLYQRGTAKDVNLPWKSYSDIDYESDNASDISSQIGPSLVNHKNIPSTDFIKIADGSKIPKVSTPQKSDSSFTDGIPQRQLSESQICDKSELQYNDRLKVKGYLKQPDTPLEDIVHSRLLQNDVRQFVSVQQDPPKNDHVKLLGQNQTSICANTVNNSPSQLPLADKSNVSEESTFSPFMRLRSLMGNRQQGYVSAKPCDLQKHSVNDDFTNHVKTVKEIGKETFSCKPASSTETLTQSDQNVNSRGSLNNPPVIRYSPGEKGDYFQEDTYLSEDSSEITENTDPDALLSEFMPVGFALLQNSRQNVSKKLLANNDRHNHSSNFLKETSMSDSNSSGSIIPVSRSTVLENLKKTNSCENIPFIDRIKRDTIGSTPNPGSNDILAEPGSDDILAEPGSDDILAEPGSDGILAESGSTRSDGILTEPGSDGILAESGSTRSDGILTEPGSDGILAESGSTRSDGILAEPRFDGILAEPKSDDIPAERGSDGILAEPGSEGILAERVSKLPVSKDGRHRKLTTKENDLTYASHHASILSAILSKDASSIIENPRRPKGLQETPNAAGKVCFSEATVNESGDSKIAPTAMSSPVKATVLKSILKKTPPSNKAHSGTSSLDTSLSSLTPSDRGQFEMSSQSDIEELWQTRAKVGNRLFANKLFAQLSSESSSSFKLQSSDIENEGRYGSTYRPPDGVLVQGNMVLKPVEKLEDANLHPQVVRVLKEKGFKAPHLIEAYCWPIIMRGRDAIGIAKGNTAHIRAYLGPVITHLLEGQPYPRGGGPMVIVICSTWRRAKTVQGFCEGLLGELHRPRVMTIYGGGCEENFNIPLIEGCEILITTPLCLQRKLKTFIHLTRLSYLVIDEADEVMANFFEQIKTVMEAFKEVIVRRGSVSMPRQMMLFSSRWTKSINSFMDSFMLEPVLVLASQFEAAVYGGVSHYVKMILPGQKLDKLVELVSQPLDGKTIIFTANSEEAVMVYETLKSQSRYVLLATAGMDLHSVVKDWNLPHQAQSQPILVCTDEVVFDVLIEDASVVIHYSMAPSKTRFGNRLSCTKQFYKQWNEPQQPKVSPRSHIFVTEDCGEILLSLEEMLVRSKSKIPYQFKQMLAGLLQGREEKNTSSLCYYLKAFGTCKRPTHCEARHRISAELDACRQLTMGSNVPKQGEVKVLVTYVCNASQFYIRILQHRTIDGTCQRLDELHESLYAGIQAWFAIPENKLENGPVQYGDLCCCPDGISRVMVLEEGNYNNYATQRHKNIKIFYVDEGRTETVRASTLLKLPDEFKSVPFQAVEAYLCKISPVDSDSDWIPRADRYMVDLVKDKELWGKIVLSLGGTIWLDPLVERIYHKNIKVTTTTTSIRMSLIRHGYAVDNTKHLDNLYGLCKDRINLPDYSKNVLDIDPVIESLTEIEGEETPVYMAGCENPQHFYLQLVDMESQLERLMNHLQEEVSKTGLFLGDNRYKVGTICLAKFSVDDRWYRGRILSILDEETAEIFFVDYGDKQTVKRDDLKDISDKFMKLPFQAIECCLAHAKPLDGEWRDSDGDALYDVTLHFNGDRRQLFAKVVDTEPAQYSGSDRYHVELAYLSCYENVSVLQELVYSKHCQTDSSTIQPMFPEIPSKETTEGIKYQPLINICRSLFDETNPLLVRQLVFKLKSQLEAICDSNTSDDLPEEVLDSVWNLTHCHGNVNHSRVNTQLLPCVTNILKVNTKHFERILKLSFVRVMCTAICRSPSEDVKISCLQSLIDLSPATDLGRQVLFEDNLEALVITIRDTTSPQIMVLVLEVLNLTCEQPERLIEGLREQKAFDIFIQQVSKHKDNMALCRTFCHLLSTLSKAEHDLNELKKEGLLKLVVDIARETTDHEVIIWTSQLMHRLVERCRKNKTLILEAGYVPVLKGLGHRFPHLFNVLGDLWDQVLTSLDVKAPKEQLSEGIAMVTRGKLSSNAHRNFGKSIFPEVRWSQNSFSVLLSVQLRDVQQKVITYTENSVSFKATQENKSYGFDFVVYDSIIPDKCREEVRGSEVLIKLRKEQKGRWSRLLKDKSKPGYLFVDHERFQDSSSDQASDEDSDESLFVLKRSTKGKPLPETRSDKKLDEVPPISYSSSDSEDSIYGNEADSDENDIFKL